MKAYVTLTTEDFVVGTVAMAKSLRRFSEKPIVAMCLDVSEQSKAVLRRQGVQTLDVPLIENPYTGEETRNNGRFKTVYTKLHAFRLEQFERIVFLDSDTIVNHSIEHLFDRPGFWAANDRGKLINAHRFNSGVFVTVPSQKVFDRMIAHVPDTLSKDNSDQGFLNEFFKDRWRRMEWTCNALKRVYEHHPEIYDLRVIKVIHYVGIKPWMNDPDDNAIYGRLNEVWHKVYES